jgi:hypothetical protein
VKLYLHFLNTPSRRGALLKKVPVGLIGLQIAPSQDPYIHRTAQRRKKHGHPSMPREGFEPTTPVFERLRTIRSLEHEVTGAGFPRTWTYNSSPYVWRWYLWVPGAFSRGVKRQGREGGHSPLCSAEVKNAWGYTFPRYAFMAWCSDKAQVQYKSMYRIYNLLPVLYLVKGGQWKETENSRKLKPHLYKALQPRRARLESSWPWEPHLS